MPTARPRLTVTETDDLAAALDAAARRWPEDKGSRSRLLLRLVEQGRASLDAERGARLARRRAAVRRTAGVLKGVYRPNELEELRKDWPE